MDKQKLVATGLQPQQADVYRLLIQHGAVLPASVASELKLTRTNAYKLLDRLVELGLAHKAKVDKKLTYQPSNPMALTQLTSDARSKVTAQEEAVKLVMGDLLEHYYEKTEQPSVQIVTGRTTVADTYRQQIVSQQPIYFIRSQADIPTMGYDVMHDIRVTPGRHGQERFGITPDTHPEARHGDARSKLTRTWAKREDYTAPVEWSVCGSTLLIVLFGKEPHAIIISNPVVADAFRQLWSMLDTMLRAMPYYNDLPRTAGPIQND